MNHATPACHHQKPIVCLAIHHFISELRKEIPSAFHVMEHLLVAKSVQETNALNAKKDTIK